MTPTQEQALAHKRSAEARAQWWREQLSDSQLTTLCAACGWQGGTFWQVVDEIRRLKAAENEVTRIATQLRAAGATLPAPSPAGTVESAMNMGLCIALAIVEDKP